METSFRVIGTDIEILKKDQPRCVVPLSDVLEFVRSLHSEPKSPGNQDPPPNTPFPGR